MARLPEYLRALSDFLRHDIDTVSSGDLAAAAGVNPAQLRRDLSYLGSYGVRGVGYDAAHLAAEIGRRLGVGGSRPIVIVGAGRLGQALAGYPGFAGSGFRVVAVLDRDPNVIGRRVGDVVIGDVATLAQVVTDEGAGIGVVATSAEGSQEACDALVDAGITSLLTFAPGPLQVPERVLVRRVDMATELAVLAFRSRAQAAENTSDDGGGAGDDVAGDLGDDADLDRGPRRFSGGLSAALTGRSIEDVDTPAHETTARVDTERQVAR